jgi:hypothetical protein
MIDLLLKSLIVPYSAILIFPDIHEDIRSSKYIFDHFLVKKKYEKQLRKFRLSQYWQVDEVPAYSDTVEFEGQQMKQS